MLEARVEMAGLVQQLDLSEVHVVDMSVDPEETLQNGFGHLQEVRWKGHTYAWAEKENNTHLVR